MIKTKVTLFEKDGVYYFNGEEVKIGEYIKLDGVGWKVLGGGRSPGKSGVPFLWVKNERYGTSVFVPDLIENSPHRAQRTPEKEFVPTLEYQKAWKSKNVEAVVTHPDFSDIASLSKVKVAPERWGRFKKALLKHTRSADAPRLRVKSPSLP